MKQKYFLGLVVLTAAILTAHGDIIPTLDSVTPEGTDFRWNYTANVTIDQKVTAGDYFTIYDFGSLLPGSNVQPAGWTFSSLLIGTTPATVLPKDNPNILNLTWTYNGATPISGSAFLGTFSVVSTTNQLRTDYFTAHATRASGSTKIDNIGFVSVPVPEMSALAPIIGVCGLGAIGYLSSLLRRRIS